MRIFASFFLAFIYVYCVSGEERDTVFYDKQWKETVQTKAAYFRIWHKENKNAIVKVEDYYAAGQLQMTGQFLSKKMKTKIGEFIWYHKNGFKKCQVFYVKGKKDGNVTEWFKSGNINYTGSYSKGKKTGEWLYYFDGTKKCASLQYVKDKKQSEQYWGENGKVVEDVKDANVRATYKGGEEALRSVIKNNVKYPEGAQHSGIQGRVYVTFVIDTIGNMKDIKIAKSVSVLLDMEALRVVNLLQHNWTPGKKFNRWVDYSFTVPINFVLRKENKGTLKSMY